MIGDSGRLVAYNKKMITAKRKKESSFSYLLFFLTKSLQN